MPEPSGCVRRQNQMVNLKSSRTTNQKKRHLRFSPLPTASAVGGWGGNTVAGRGPGATPSRRGLSWLLAAILRTGNLGTYYTAWTTVARRLHRFSYAHFAI